MNKRGEAETLELTMLFEILIGIAIAAFLVLAALNWNSLSNFNQLYVEEDLMLLSNTLLSTPGAVSYKYPLSSSLKVEMTPTNIKIVSSPSFFAMTDKTILLMETSHKADSINIKRLDNV
ncbi:MAG: hypothetical protein KKF52_02765 [Nanoarchaeota archaeon]|nr:hypothetical protein [Nanoarchaeota archaeon]MBU4242132.1 hypothetical protein [Nanoarchaeota archaeon]MBU4352250.1 hypothetical protein [Nanoarchaeota archaeon]